MIQKINKITRDGTEYRLGDVVQEELQFYEPKIEVIDNVDNIPYFKKDNTFILSSQEGSFEGVYTNNKVFPLLQLDYIEQNFEPKIINQPTKENIDSNKTYIIANDNQEIITYSVNLNDQWRENNDINPDTSLYECYESFSNYNVSSGVATMYINVNNTKNFKFYIRSNGESDYDYLTVNKLDDISSGYISYYNGKGTTKGQANANTDLSSYKLIEFTQEDGLDGGEHIICIKYGKDYSANSGTDRGYIIIPKDQNILVSSPLKSIIVNGQQFEIPTKTSQLTNDSGFLTELPEGTLNGYATESYVSTNYQPKGTYITQHQDISGKVDKEDGKGLSTNDYTTDEKNKLAGIEEGAQVNPTKVSELTNDVGYITEAPPCNYNMIIEDDVEVSKDDTKGIAPYSTSYGYTNITITNPNIHAVEGGIYSFIIDTKMVVASSNRNVRVRFGEDGEWHPMMNYTTSAIGGNTYFVKNMTCVFQYKSTIRTEGAFHLLYDANTTYNINYIQNSGRYKVVDDHLLARYSLVGFTEEGKVVSLNKNYSLNNNKTPTNVGIDPTRLLHYNNSSSDAAAKSIIASLYIMRVCDARQSLQYSTTFPDLTDIYIKFKKETDGLFYLDQPTADNPYPVYHATALPEADDGYYYWYIGRVSSANSYNFHLTTYQPLYKYDSTKGKAVKVIRETL